MQKKKNSKIKVQQLVLQTGVIRAVIDQPNYMYAPHDVMWMTASSKHMPHTKSKYVP